MVKLVGGDVMIGEWEDHFGYPTYGQLGNGIGDDGRLSDLSLWRTAAA